MQTEEPYLGLTYKEKLEETLVCLSQDKRFIQVLHGCRQLVS